MPKLRVDVNKLTELTLEARMREMREREEVYRRTEAIHRTWHEDRERIVAEAILAEIPRRLAIHASKGKRCAVVMCIGQRLADQATVWLMIPLLGRLAVGLAGSRWLTGAAKTVYDECETAGLNPKVIFSRYDIQIVARW